MNFKYQKSTKINSKEAIVYIIENSSSIENLGLTNQQLKYVKSRFKEKTECIELNLYTHQMFLFKPTKEKDETLRLEKYRLEGANIATKLSKLGLSTVQIVGADRDLTLALSEGLGLKSYGFNKYFKDKKDRESKLKSISIICNKVSKIDVERLNITTAGVFYSRDLVNEPLSFLTATQLSKEIVTLSKEAGFSVEVFGKKKIEALKMGGLLAVNKGSIDPPTFTVMEWKPKNAKNKKPYVLVGKGVVYDTGGLSLKPTANSMDQMKSDMGGAAMMVGAMYSIARAKLDVHVIGLIPATDNRPGLNAYAPGDIVKMHNGLTVEVKNTDAEGRMLLADALSYAQKYKPALVFDAATLTGAAVRSFGTAGACIMGTASDNVFTAIEKSGNRVFERMIKQPFWADYGKGLESDIADLKNLGGPYGGHISAGKFLEHFTDYPWIHFDIAGTAFINKPEGYRPKWGTGTGVRMLFDFFANV